MPLRLILMRHAKSSWEDPRLDDFDRVLNGRGRRNAATMGAWLRENDYLPDQALVSTAARTRETYAHVAKTLELTLAKEPVKALYLASEDRILQELRRAQGRTVLLIAHNPGIAEFAARFAKNAPAHPDFHRYPTCATSVYELDGETWDEARFGAGRVIDFAVPRDLNL